MSDKKPFNELIKGSVPVLVDFYADWCGPCKAMTPVLESLATEWQDKVKVIKINVDKNQAIASQFQVRSIPTFIIFKEGKIAWKHTGTASTAEFKKVVESL